MRIANVSLVVPDLAIAADFYERTLMLPVARLADHVRVTVGSTTLNLTGDPHHQAAHHLAITVPSNKFEAAKAWVRERADLLTVDGDDEFECSSDWNAHSLYFEGHDRTVLELIIRRDLNNATDGAFTSSDLLGVSEVGIAVPDVSSVVRILSDRFGIDPYGWTAPDFAPVGDVNGLLILVGPGRAWFPTNDRLAQITPMVVAAQTGNEANIVLNAVSRLELN